MLAISNTVLTAFEAGSRLDQRRDFAAWLRRHGDLVGDVPPHQAARTLEDARPGAAKAGIDTDERLFAFALAHGLMPAMTAAQYLLALDLVFAPLGEREKIEALVRLRDRPNG